LRADLKIPGNASDSLAYRYFNASIEHARTKRLALALPAFRNNYLRAGWGTALIAARYPVVLVIREGRSLFRRINCIFWRM